jgi:DNA-binding MarR family transcriptional regulator
VVVLTEAGAEQLAKAEYALAEVDEQVLGALDASQRETLYTLLQLAATGTGVSCPKEMLE